MIQLAALIENLSQIDKIPSEEWMQRLDERKKKELEFHNLHRDKTIVEEKSLDAYEKFYGNKKYYTTTQKSQSYVQNWIRNSVKDKVFLDYACGNGSQAIFAAKCGAALAIGLDISDVSVQNARVDAKREKVTDSTFFVQADAENTLLPDSSVDIILCSGMLHHLDLSFAFPELRRILKPQGKIIAVEALDYNPLIKLYRLLTPDMRTDWEKKHILSMKDIRFAEHFFDIGEIRYWHILSYVGAHVPSILPILDKCDKFLTRVPLLNKMAWIFSFELLSKK